MRFKNIIFDLGGVLLDLSVERTVESFAQLSGKTREQVLELYSSSTEFIQYEMGKISDQEFRSTIRRIFQLNHSDVEIDRCWNAMLVTLPQAKLDLLQKLKDSYTVCLLSNTNGIHLDHINKNMLPNHTQGTLLDVYFHRPYYSHLLKMRKPNEDIFLHVLNENTFNPAETIFLDDNADNIRTAANLGIQTLLIKHPKEVIDFFEAL